MQVSVKTVTGKTVTLNIESSEQIENVSLKLNNKEEIKPYNQGFINQIPPLPIIPPPPIFHQSPFPKGNGFLPKPLAIGYKSTMKITVTLLTGEKITLDVALSDSILKLKSKIQEKEGIQVKQQRLTLEGIVLRDSNIIADYRIYEGSVIILEVIKPQSMKVCFVVEYEAGKRIFLDAMTSDSIASVKTQIHKKERIPVKQQMLFISSKKLDDERNLADYNICNSSVINLVIKPSQEFRLLVKAYKGKVVTLYVKSSDSIACIKNKIQQNVGFYFQTQKLILSGIILNDEKTLADYGIYEESKLPLIYYGTNNVRLYIRTSTGDTFAIYADSIRNLKYKIEDSENIPYDEQKLLFMGIELEDNRNFADYNIKEGSTLNLETIKRSVIKIIVKTVTGKTINLDVDSQDLVERFKTKIKDNTGIPIGEQKLLFAAKLLADKYTLADYGIVEGSTIYLLNRVKSEIKICVKTLNGRNIALDVESSELIENVMKRIEEKENIPVCKQKLIFAGQLLESQRSLAEYNINQGSTLFLTV